jgi:diketogulonate reductase-like aldo/keto reductase
MSCFYYRTEADVGRGIQKSGVRREDIFVVNKLFQNGYSRCLEIVHESLKK